MKKVIGLAVVSIVAIGLAGVAQADLMATFDFTGLTVGDGRGAIETYMQNILTQTGLNVGVTVSEGFPASVKVATANPSGSASPTLGPGNWVLIDAPQQGGEPEGLLIEFTTGVTTVVFDWEKQHNAFYFDAGGINRWSDLTADSGNSATVGLMQKWSGAPVTTLAFHDSGNGYVGIDNLSVTFVSPVVPVPAAALLGFLGLSAAGMKLRRFV